jgi:hypothetical protein
MVVPVAYELWVEAVVPVAYELWYIKLQAVVLVAYELCLQATCRYLKVFFLYIIDLLYCTFFGFKKKNDFNIKKHVNSIWLRILIIQIGVIYGDLSVK